MHYLLIYEFVPDFLERRTPLRAAGSTRRRSTAFARATSSRGEKGLVT